MAPGMPTANDLPPGAFGAPPSRTPDFEPRIAGRLRYAEVWRRGFLASTLVAILSLLALLYNVVNGAFGYSAVEVRRDPTTILFQGVPLDRLDAPGLEGLLRAELSKNVVRTLDRKEPLATRSRAALRRIAEERLVKPNVVHSWPLVESVLRPAAVRAQHAADFPGTRLEFRSWLNARFVLSPQDADADVAGVRTAALGSLWMIAITILFAFPVGIGAAIYLEEYADPNGRVNRLIRTNIYNLAGVPSIIYGMLGLVILARFLKAFTSGAAFGLAADGASTTGRTILSAGLTLGLLILPVLIINGQEALRAVPNSLRQASYGIGATKWQTIAHHVLPSALPGILTGTILAISRAIGETAPILVVGASTYAADPTGPFSKFTALPIQIYQWTSRPEDVFRNIAAAAILVLLALLLTLNASAVLLRNRYGVKG